MQACNLAMCGLALLLASCGGTDANSVSESVASDASPGGIWQGHDSVSGLSVLGLIDEAGDFRLIREDHVQYLGTANVSGNIVSGNTESVAERGRAVSDGTAHGTGTMHGSVVERQSLRLSLAEQSDDGTPRNLELVLSYDQFYEVESSLAAVAGHYVEARSGTVFDVDATGHFSARDTTLNCSIDGNVSIIHPHYNIYDIAYSYSSCSGQAVALNGVTATGKGTFTDFGVGAQVLASVTYTISGKTVGLIVELDRF